MFRLYADPSDVVVGGVAVEQSPFSFRSSRGVFVVVVVHSIRSLFHIQFTRVNISLLYFSIIRKCYREKMLELYVHCTVTSYTVLSNLNVIEKKNVKKKC